MATLAAVRLYSVCSFRADDLLSLQGIPNTAAVNTVNRQCSSGLAAVTQIANEIATGQIDIGIGASQRRYFGFRS